MLLLFSVLLQIFFWTYSDKNTTVSDTSLDIIFPTYVSLTIGFGGHELALFLIS